MIFEPVVRTETRLPDGKWRIACKPPEWAIPEAPEQVVILSDDQYQRYRSWINGGVLIQQALPELPGSQREILMSGIGPDTWDKEFNDDETEEEF